MVFKGIGIIDMTKEIKKVQNYDLVVVGTGSGGISAALYAANNGLKTAIIENTEIGGIAVLSDDLQMKLMQKHAKIASEVQQASEWGFEITEFSLDYNQLKNKLFSFSHEKKSRIDSQLKEHGVIFHLGKASIDEEGTLYVNDIKINTKNTLLASNSQPVIPDILDIEKKDFITISELYILEKIPESLTIIGGGMTAVETAFSLAPLGTVVTIIERNEDILMDEDADVRYVLKKKLAKFNVVMLTNQQFIKVNNNYIELENGEVFYEKLFLACGREIDYSYIYNSKIEIEAGLLKLDEYNQTTLKNIYALSSKYESAISDRAAIIQTKKIINHIMAVDEKTPEHLLIRSLNVIPAVATFGINEAQARSIYGDEIDILNFTIQNAVEGMIGGESKCHLKLIVQKEFNEILGAVAIGNQATVILEKISIIVHLEGSLEEVILCIQHDFMHILQQKKNV